MHTLQSSTYSPNFPYINHQKGEIFEQMKDQIERFSVLQQEERVSYSFGHILFLYSCELFKFYSEKLKEQDIQEIFNFLKPIALNDLQNLGFPITEEFFQTQIQGNVSSEEAVFHFIRAFLDVPIYGEMVQVILDN